MSKMALATSLLQLATQAILRWPGSKSTNNPTEEVDHFTVVVKQDSETGKTTLSIEDIEPGDIPKVIEVLEQSQETT